MTGLFERLVNVEYWMTVATSRIVFADAALFGVTVDVHLSQMLRWVLAEPLGLAEIKRVAMYNLYS